MPASPLFPQDRDTALLASAESRDYREVDDGSSLKLHFFFPPETEGAGDKHRRPALLFFFGSGFDSGQLSQFAPQALYFANRGAVGILVEYRTRQSHQATPIDAMQDARAAIAWVRAEADNFDIDPSRIIASGALGGGTVAAAAAMKDDLPPVETDPTGANGRPDALVLFSPLLQIQRGRYGFGAFSATGIPLKEAHLANYLRKGLPPTLIIHGTEDLETPCKVVDSFVRRSRLKRNRCRRVPFEGRRHSFYNLNVDPLLFDLCLAEADRFLVEEEFLDPPESTSS